MTWRSPCAIALSITLLAAGCDMGPPPQPLEDAASQAHAEPPQAAEPAEAADPADEPPEPAEPVRKKAEVGVGARGHDLGLDPVSTPVKAYFVAREQVAFDVQIPSAMNLFKATEGRAPRSHDEFMQKIVRPNRIQLPELPPGHVYKYDPEKEELFVEHP